MKYPRYEKEITSLLESGEEVDVRDFVRVFHGMPMPSVYARIRKLVVDEKLSPVGKGKYIPISKPAYRVEISTWMQECHNVMIDELEGVNSCLTERKGNLEVEVPKEDMVRTVEVLKRHFEKVMYRKDVRLLAAPPVGFVLVGRLISDSPVMLEQEVGVPSLEKELVDAICRNEYDASYFQRMMEVYPTNRNRMHRYAARRGVAEELAQQLSQVDTQRVELFGRLQRYLAHTRIVRAWVFGSFARGEETPESDLDLLVDYDKTQDLSLLSILRYQKDIERLIGRKVDLVENGFLKPFALASANEDKYLIYER